MSELESTEKTPPPEYYTPPTIKSFVKTLTVVPEGETFKSCKPEFNGVKITLEGEWDRLGLYADDLDTMAMDMELALNKIIRKYIAFNKSRENNHKEDF